MSAKVIVTNRAALAAKYGSAGAAQVQAAVQALATADAARGIHTTVVHLDDAAEMAVVGGTAVATATDPAQNKAAVDAVAARLGPDFLMILGAVDVVPFQDLKNPAYTGMLGNDVDPTAWSDLPYACTAPYSQDVRDFLGPTRVVGRLPDLTRGPGEGPMDTAYLLGVLREASGWRSGAASDYSTAYFGLSTADWQASTSASVAGVFGSAEGLALSPPGGSPPGWPAPALGRTAWFINCHGATVQPKFYGQQATDYPVALLSSDLPGVVASGSVGAAECCYGAELYAPALRKGAMGIANAFLGSGGWGWFGSTTTAYGPAAPPLAQADLICQSFMRGVLAGATLGEAGLRAHLDYVAGTPVMSPIDLKTVAQFVLLGDPSVQPVAPPPASLADPSSAAAAVAAPPAVADRSAARARMRDSAPVVAAGASTAAVETVQVQPAAEVGQDLRALMARMRRPPHHVASFAVQPAPAVQAAAADRAGFRMAAEPRPERVHLLFSEADPTADFPAFEVLVAHETAGVVTLHEHLFRH